MGTRSAIGMVMPDKTIRAIYCHWDGYPSHHAPILANHYTAPEKVKALIDLGSLSSLGEEIGHKIDFESRDTGNQCKAYGRDRGETDIEAKVFKTKAALKKYFDDSEFFYIYNNGEWIWSSAAGRSFRKLKVTETME